MTPIAPGETGASPGLRARAADIGCVLLGYAGAYPALVGHPVGQPGQPSLDLVLAVAVPPLLLARRSRPVPVAVAALIAVVASPVAGTTAGIATLTVALYSSTAMSLAVAGASLAAVLASVAVRGLALPYVPVLGLLVLIGAVEIGLLVRTRRQLVLAAQEREDHRQSEQRERIAGARSAERLRIAREIHDALGHRLTLLNLHAGALTYRPDCAPEELLDGIEVIRRNSAEVLEDLQEAIGVLRGTSDPTGHSRRPTLAALPCLVEDARRGGDVIHAALPAESPGDTADDTAGRTTYRIVQEALTNARRHAPGAEVHLTVSRGQTAIEVTVSNSMTPEAPGSPGAGTGLIGISERIALVGGTLRYGPNSERRFVLEARIPWAP